MSLLDWRPKAKTDKLEAEVRNRYRHLLADLDATEAELKALGTNGYTLTPDEIRDRIRRFRAALLSASTQTNPPRTEKAINL
jgi:hypothetical protein